MAPAWRGSHSGVRSLWFFKYIFYTKGYVFTPKKTVREICSLGNSIGTCVYMFSIQINSNKFMVVSRYAQNPWATFLSKNTHTTGISYFTFRTNEICLNRISHKSKLQLPTWTSLDLWLIRFKHMLFWLLAWGRKRDVSPHVQALKCFCLNKKVGLD